MRFGLARRPWRPVFLVWVGTLFALLPVVSSNGEGVPIERTEFSGSLVKRVNGKRFYAQVFAKPDRVRLEYRYAIRTAHGYAAIEIIRLDRQESWYLLAQQKELLVVPLDPEVLPIRQPLSGERARIVVGDATMSGRAAQLSEVHTDRKGRAERFYEWADLETGVILKLVSQDRDWSVEYEPFRISPQPDMYFQAPPGYKKRVHADGVQQP